MRLITKQAWSKHGGQTCPLVSGSSLLSVLEVPECQHFPWDPRKLDQNGFVVRNAPTPCSLWGAVCTDWSQQACLFTCKSSPSQALCTQSCGKWITPQKKAPWLSFFKSVICCCCLWESVHVLKGRASEKRRLFYIVFVKRAENENMAKRDEERERERISNGVPQILGAPNEPWDAWKFIIQYINSA